MKIDNLLKLIPEETFRELAVETKVDFQVKKLSGEVMFKLIMFSMLNSDKLSLRVMETFLQSARFKTFAHFDILEGKYNSIRDRICTINAEYFEKLFNKIFSIYNKELKEEEALSKTDSTYVSIAAKLFSNGMVNGGSKDSSKRFVKYSVNLKGSLPSAAKVFVDQAYISEELALAEVINDTDCIQDNIVLFDRGLQSRNSFDKFTQSNKMFVTRANLPIQFEVVGTKDVAVKAVSGTVTLTSDQTGFLRDRTGKRTQYPYRLIKGTIDKTGELIYFLTNIIDKDAYLIAAWYKQRWEIEVFFKFLKQHLNVKHLVSRDENGIKVMIYMTMIVAILIIAFKKINEIKSFKIAKLKFEIALENDIIQQIVLLCGGNPNKAAHLFNSA